MQNLLKKAISLALSAALCIGCVGLVSAETENTKDETVYVLTGSDGSVEKIIVSDWLKNADSAAALEDESDLTDIKTVKGDATFTSDGITLTWDTAGGDVYYQGSSDKEPPVAMHVAYTLDGEAVEPEALVGKSGRVTIRFDYEDKAYEMKEISGQEEKIYVPFVVITGLVLDNDRFRNVEVTNGKLINDGDRTAVIGLALPGMQESLALDSETLELPDYVEITADVTDFQMSMTLTLISSQPFAALSENTALDSNDGITEAVSQLTSGLTQLTDGSGQLAEGLETLLEKAGELSDGVGQLTSGAQNLYDGSVSLRDGADELNSGAAELSAGLTTLTDNNATLNGGADQVFATLLASATSQLKAAGVEVPDLTAENYSQVLGQILSALPASSESYQTVAALRSSLDSYAEFAAGLKTYTASVASAASGAEQLLSGASRLCTGAATLSDGAGELRDGVNQLNESMPTLTDGVTQLLGGAVELSDGIQEFIDEIDEKISDLTDGDLETLTARLTAAIQVAQDYQTFTALPDAMTGQVKFIYRTDEIQ